MNALINSAPNQIMSSLEVTHPCELGELQSINFKGQNIYKVQRLAKRRPLQSFK